MDIATCDGERPGAIGVPIVYRSVFAHLPYPIAIISKDANGNWQLCDFNNAFSRSFRDARRGQSVQRLPFEIPAVSSQVALNGKSFRVDSYKVLNNTIAIAMVDVTDQVATNKIFNAALALI